MRIRPVSAALRPHRGFLGGVVLCTVLALSSPGVCVVGSHHGLKKDAKHQIEGIEVQWRDAQLTGNVGEMDRLLSEDYFGITMTGQVNNKAQQLERIRSRKLVFSKIDLSDRKVKLIGTTAVVTSRAEVEGTSEGEAMRGSFRYTRVYQRGANGQWRITNFEATRLTEPDGAGSERRAEAKAR